MRSEPPSPYRSVTFILVVTITAIYLLQGIVYMYFRGLPSVILNHLTLNPFRPSRPYEWIWQIFTYQFFHGGWLHLFCNLITLYFMGNALEAHLSRKTFTLLFLASGAAGGILQLICGVLFPTYFAHTVVGASGSICGLIAAFAWMFKDQSMGILFLPVSFPAIYFLVGVLFFAAYGMLVPIDGIAHAAHMGGLLLGLAFAHIHLSNPDWSFSWPKLPQPYFRPRELVGTASQRRTKWQSSKPPEAEELPPEEFISKEVDPILDKISAHGIQSLTPRERQILEAARSKMASGGNKSKRR